MITDEERVIRQSQGYDIGFEYYDKNIGLIPVLGMKRKVKDYFKRQV